jgi:SchA/CurD like domain
MERHALAFRIKRGSESAVAQLLADYRAPDLQIDAETRLVGTAVFIRSDLVIRVVEVEGDLAKVGPHLARDPVIQQVERALVPYLLEPYDSTDAAQRGQFFAQRLMTRIVHREAPDVATAVESSRHALLYPVQPGKEAAVAQVLQHAKDPPLRQGSTRLLNTSVFRKDGVLVRIFGIHGSVEELVDGLSRAVEVHDVGLRLAALFSGPYDFTSGSDLQRFFSENMMTVVTDRSAATVASGTVTAP